MMCAAFEGTRQGILCAARLQMQTDIIYLNDSRARSTAGNIIGSEKVI